MAGARVRGRKHHRTVRSTAAGRGRRADRGVAVRYPDVFGLAAVLMAFGLFAAVRRGRLSSKRLLDLGLVFQVAGALGIAVPEFWHGLAQSADGYQSTMSGRVVDSQGAAVPGAMISVRQTETNLTVQPRPRPMADSAFHT